MRYNEFKILLEYRRDVTASKMGPQLLQAATRDMQYKSTQTNQNPEEQVDDMLSKFEKMDHTPNKQYVPWIARQYINGMFRMEDYSRVTDTLTNFNKLKPRLEQSKRDINRFNFRQLEAMVDEILNPQVGSETTGGTFPVVDDSKVLYNGPLGQLAIPETQEASCQLGGGTKWCTAAEKNNMFDFYSRNGPLYVWRDRNGSKYQFWFPQVVKDDHIEVLQDGKSFCQFMDARDDPIDEKLAEYFRTQHPVIKQVFQNYEKHILKNPDVNLVLNYVNATQAPWPAGEDIILEYRWAAYSYAKNIIKGRWEPGEKIISTNSMASLNYAREVLGHRFPQGEQTISKDGSVAIEYATDVIKGRFPLGEAAIAEDPFTAFRYATEIIKGKWPPGEEAIADSHSTALWYAKQIIGGPWPPGEEAISRNGDASADYAINVLKGRFPLGEKAIRSSKRLTYEYDFYMDKFENENK